MSELDEIRRSMAGKVYRPANGTDGMLFEESWCRNCTFADQCELPLLAQLNDVWESEYPHQWRYDADGNPMCAAFNRKPTPEQEREYKEAVS